MDTIKIPRGIWHAEYTKEQLQKELNDLRFLKDAFLVLLNEDATKKSWDIPYTKDEAKRYALEMYRESGEWCEDFINECFGIQK